MFENAYTTTQRGDVGEARAIYEYARLGFVVSKPINDKARYDLILDDGQQLKRVQVKTTTRKIKDGVFEAKISSSYANRNNVMDRKREDGDYDLLFILNELGQCWSIPSEVLTARKAVRVGTEKYAQYKI